MPKRVKTTRQVERESGKTLPPAYRPDDRPSARKRGYDSSWERFALAYLRHHPLCAECERQGRPMKAYAVDHIVPWREWKNQGGSKYDKGNLQPLCRACHAAKSAREGR